MFHFAGAKIVQERPPLFVFFEILGDMLGKQNVPSIPSFHHPLRYVETCSREIRATSHIDHTTDRTAVYSHAKLQARVLFKRTTDFDRTLRRRFWTRVKHQRHAIASRKFY